MKRIILSIAAAMMAVISYNAQAQSLTDLLKGTKVGNVVDAVTTAVGVATNTVSLPGTWIYKGAAVDLQSGSTLSSLAGTAVSSGVETKINNAFEKVGIKEGAVKFVFNDGMSFTCTIFGKTLNGTWKHNAEENKLTLQFGQTMKYLSIYDRLHQGYSYRNGGSFRCQQVPLISEDRDVRSRKIFHDCQCHLRHFQFI